MKKGKLINAEISYIISKMGHTDMLTICDSGLPISKDVQRIDLALSEGIPSFLDTLDTVLDELKVEEVVVAKEMKEVSPNLYKKLISKFEEIEKEENIKISIREISHEDFKDMTKDSMGVIRTGEYTPYANIILKSGVVF